MSEAAVMPCHNRKASVQIVPLKRNICNIFHNLTMITLHIVMLTVANDDIRQLNRKQ